MSSSYKNGILHLTRNTRLVEIPFVMLRGRMLHRMDAAGANDRFYEIYDLVQQSDETDLKLFGYDSEVDMDRFNDSRNHYIDRASIDVLSLYRSVYGYGNNKLINAVVAHSAVMTRDLVNGFYRGAYTVDDLMAVFEFESRHGDSPVCSARCFRNALTEEMAVRTAVVWYVESRFGTRFLFTPRR